MKLEKNSLSARVYRDFYNTKDMPQSLCPYFWKLLFAWPFTVLFALFALPIWLVERRGKKTHVPMVGKAFFGLVLYATIVLIFSIGVAISAYWITYYNGTPWFEFYKIGVLTGLLSIVVMIVFGIFILIDKIRDRAYYKAMRNAYDENGNWIPEENRPKTKGNILIEFIKGAYLKYCPKIDWN